MISDKIKFYISSSAIILLATLIIAPVIVFAWTDPTAVPPTENVPAPVNVGSTAQTKQGDFRINRSGTGERVGIGSSSPSNSLTLDYDTGYSDLHVNGSGYFADSVILNFVPSNDLHATNKYYVDNLVSGISHWDESGNDIYNTNTGNVGIGTTNPISLLDVKGEVNIGDGGDKIRIRDSGVTAIIDSEVNPLLIRTSGDNDITFQTNGTNDRMTIDNSGSVGIGTTNPSAMLEINNDPDGGTILHLEGYNNNSPVTIMTVIDENSNVDFSLTSLSDGGATGATGYFRGSVGIGTANPISALDVKGDITLTDDIVHSGDPDTKITFDTDRIRFGVGGVELADFSKTTQNVIKLGHYGDVDIDMGGHGEIFLEGSSGNVGIGTASPGVNLEVIGAVNIGDFSDNGVGNLQVKGDGADYGITVWNESVVTYRMWIDEANDTGHLTRGTDATAGISIETNGYVGISTADPDVELHVEGDAKVTGELELGGSDVAEEFVVDRGYPAGTVLVMGNSGYKSAWACDMEYDTKVIGVVSDRAALIMGRVDSKFKEIVALVGVVKVKVNNSNGQIYKGDLLTTSSVYGQAMKAVEPKVGTIIGKALENSWTREGEIMALINLQ